MGRGVSCGGGRSSLGYLFGSDSDGAISNTSSSSSSKPPLPAITTKKEEDASSSTNSNKPPPPATATKKEEDTKSSMVHRKENNSSPIKWEAQPPSSAQPGQLKNNYYRSDGQNCGNFITDRPTTKVHAAPGGGSSLGYLFGDPNKK